MRKLRALAALVTFLLPAALGQPAVGEPDKKVTTEFRIAVVDPHRVEKESKWAAKLLLDVNNRYRANLESLKKANAELAKKRSEQRLWTPGSEEHDRLKLDIVRLEHKLQNEDAMFNKWWRDWRAEAYIAIHEECAKRARFLAEKRGYAIVLRKTRPPANASALNRLAAIETAAILYAAPKHDLTKDVIRLIDAERAKPAEATSNGKTKDQKKDQ